MSITSSRRPSPVLGAQVYILQYLVQKLSSPHHSALSYPCTWSSHTTSPPGPALVMSVLHWELGGGGFPMHSTRACDASENEVGPDLCAALDLQLSLRLCYWLNALPQAFFLSLFPLTKLNPF